MANHFSALKRARQTERRTARNRANRSRLRTALRNLRESLAKGDKQAAEQSFRQTVSALDKAIQKGVAFSDVSKQSDLFWKYQLLCLMSIHLMITLISCSTPFLKVSGGD